MRRKRRFPRQSFKIRGGRSLGGLLAQRIGSGSFKGFGRRPQVVRPIVVPGLTRRSGFFGRFGQGGELKFHDVDVDDATITAGATIAAATVNIIPQGTTEVQRIGRKCTIRSINWRFSMNKSATTNEAQGGDIVRVIMYLDKQCNGATAATTDILESADYQSFNNLANKSRFRTLMDRTYTINAEAAGGDGTTIEVVSQEVADTFFKKVNIPIEFDSTTGAITEIRSNNIGVMTLSKTGLVGFASKLRLRFSDN